jgi:hypothetical protein
MSDSLSFVDWRYCKQLRVNSTNELPVLMTRCRLLMPTWVPTPGGRLVLRPQVCSQPLNENVGCRKQLCEVQAVLGGRWSAQQCAVRSCPT